MSTIRPNGSGRPRAQRRGSTLPLVSVLLVMMAGMVAFAIDIGRIAHVRTEAQATADAACLAGLAKLYASSGATQNFTTARTEVNKFAGGTAANESGLSVPDADMQFGYF